MPRYKVLTKSFIDNTIVEEGDTIEFDGKPGSNLELIEDEVKAEAPKGKKAASSDSAE